MIYIIVSLVCAFLLIGTDSVQLLPSLTAKQYAKFAVVILKLAATGFLCVGSLLGFMQSL